jgi:hypothetical protein
MIKPFPIPKISTVLQELEGFTFATALDLNMGYHAEITATSGPVVAVGPRGTRCNLSAVLGPEGREM